MKTTHYVIALIASFLITINSLFPPRVDADLSRKSRCYLFGQVDKCNIQKRERSTSWTRCSIDTKTLWTTNSFIFFLSAFIILGDTVISKLGKEQSE